MYFAVLGYGLNVQMSELTRYSYHDFLFPGVLSILVFLCAFQETSYYSWERLWRRNIVSTMKLTAITETDIAMGELAWGTLKGIGAGWLFVICGGFLGLIHSWLALLTFLFIVPVALVAAAWGMLIASFNRSEIQQSGFYSLLVLPILLCSETIVPLSSHWKGFEAVVWISPVYHMTKVLRDFWLAEIGLGVLVHFGIVLLLCLVSVPYSLFRFQSALSELQKK
jgi:lipooligosaccharide transport system permease protein